MVAKLYTPFTVKVPAIQEHPVLSCCQVVGPAGFKWNYMGKTPIQAKQAADKQADLMNKAFTCGYHRGANGAASITPDVEAQLIQVIEMLNAFAVSFEKNGDGSEGNKAVCATFRTVAANMYDNLVAAGVIPEKPEEGQEPPEGPPPPPAPTPPKPSLIQIAR